MAFRSHPGGRNYNKNGSSGSSAPANYVPGVGRGATGFTTRSDVGPAAAVIGEAGSRAAAAFKSAAPQNYIAGAGRGAARLSRDNDDGNDSGTVGGVYDAFGGYMPRAPQEGQYDKDDDQADAVWAAIDERMNSKRKRSKTDEQNEPKTAEDRGFQEIGLEFRELKEKLADVSEEQWAAIPDVGDYSLKHKQARNNQQDTFTPLADTLLEQRSRTNQDASAGNAVLAANTVAIDGATTSTTNISGLSAARGTVLGMSLDKMSDSVSGQTNVDATGFLTSLAASTSSTPTAAQIGDIHKARLLLKSVRDTNPKHGPGWIAAARVEEAAGQTLQARKILQQACQVCPDAPDVWLETARLHPVPVAKSILATAVRRLPHAVHIFLKAADLEDSVAAKKAVLRKALETNPSSETLWKAAIELEEDVMDARLLLSVAVEKIPRSVELWLALARIETYKNAQAVLNRARKALPTERSIWIAASQLEESQGQVAQQGTIVNKIIERAVRSLAQHDAVVTRDQWLQDAELAEAAGAPQTSAAIIKHTIGRDVEDQDRLRTWSADAAVSLQRGRVATARAILAHALETFPTKRKLWMQLVQLEQQHGTLDSLDDVLAEASQRLPRSEIFWLLRAKEQWMAGHVDKARDILTHAFAANPDSEEVWLAAAKLEWENSEVERARVLLQRARERAPRARVYMKSALLEWEQKDFGQALQLIEEGIAQFPKFTKLYMMGGQICSDELPKQRRSLERARKFYQRGLEQCPDSSMLWILASRLEERAADFDSDLTVKLGSTKARSLLELARLSNPRNPDLWLEAVRLERRAGIPKLAESLMAKALQECPTSGILLSENILTAPRVEQKSKSSDAIKRAPDDPRVIFAVASLFALERKNEKARKWFDRAVILDPDLGDSWARYYAFERNVGSTELQKKVKERCVQADPKHGEIWTSVMKNVSNRKMTVAEGLELAADKVAAMKSTKFLG